MWVDTTENPKGGFTASVFLGGLPGAEPLGSSDKRAPGSSYVYRVADLLAANIQGGRRVRSKEEPLAAEIVAPTYNVKVVPLGHGSGMRIDWVVGRAGLPAQDVTVMMAAFLIGAKIMGSMDRDDRPVAVADVEAVVGGGVPGSQRAVLPVGGDFGVVPGYDSETASGRAAVSALRSMGVTVFVHSATPGFTSQASIDWSVMAGVDDLRGKVEDYIILPRRHKGLYHSITALTREKQVAANGGGVYVFEGPPGTGKTTTARIIASHIKLPMVVLNFDNVGSMYYGDSESKMRKILGHVRELGDAVLFIDEADTFFPARGMHSGSSHNTDNKLLSQLLTFIEGVGGASSSTTVIFATNRKKDLDMALLSRCSVILPFELPNHEARSAIWRLFAKQLTPEEIDTLASVSHGFSGRDVKKTCEAVERRHAAAIVRRLEAVPGSSSPSSASSSALPGEAGSSGITPPPACDYVLAVKDRLRGLSAGEDANTLGPQSPL